jgi:hypothetical protein
MMAYDLARDEEVQEVQVEFDYHPFCRGTRENGLPLEPDDQEAVEIISVKDKAGKEITLTKDETPLVEEAALLYLNDQKAAALEDYYESRRDYERDC